MRWSARLLSSLSALPSTLKELVANHQALSGTTVTAHGWIRSIRKQKIWAFADIVDNSFAGQIQAVIRAEDAQGLSPGCALQMRGKLSRNPKTPSAKVDLHVDQLKVLGTCPEDYPIQKALPPKVLLRHLPHLRMRSPTNVAMLRVRDACANVISQRFRELGFYQVEAPILTANDCEGGSAVFHVNTKADPQALPTVDAAFFDKPTYLSVSTQLYLEAFSASLNRVFTLAPAFRAEKSMTSRHLTEFWMLEAEISFVQELEGVMQIVEDGIKAVRKHLRRNMKDILTDLPATSNAFESAAEEKIWPRITYTDAVELLQKQSKWSRMQWGHDLSSAQEKWLADRHFQSPVFVTDYPASLKPFYMRLNQDDKTVACFDLIVPRVGELAGGSLREERLKPLLKVMQERNMDMQAYAWYLDLRKNGSVPHGGFGMGWERLINWLTGIENVRECIAFPRSTEGWEV